MPVQQNYSYMSTRKIRDRIDEMMSKLRALAKPREQSRCLGLPFGFRQKPGPVS